MNIFIDLSSHVQKGYKQIVPCKSPFETENTKASNQRNPFIDVRTAGNYLEKNHQNTKRQFET